MSIILRTCLLPHTLDTKASSEKDASASGKLLLQERLTSVIGGDFLMMRKSEEASQTQK